MMKNIAAGLSVLLFLLQSAGITQAQEPPLKVSAEELLTAYDENKLAAEHKYLNKTLELNGRIQFISMGRGRSRNESLPYMMFSNDETSNWVSYIFDPQEVEEIRKALDKMLRKEDYTFTCKLVKGKRYNDPGDCTID